MCTAKGKKVKVDITHSSGDKDINVTHLCWRDHKQLICWRAWKDFLFSDFSYDSNAVCTIMLKEL